MTEYERIKLELDRSILRLKLEQQELEKELFDELEKLVEVTKDVQDGKVIMLKQELGIGLSNEDYDLLEKYDE